MCQGLEINFILYRWIYHPETKFETYSDVSTVSQVFSDGSGLSHDQRVMWQELEKNGRDFVASVLVEGRGSLVDVEGFWDLLWEPLFLPHQNLGIIQCVTMTGGRGMFHNGRVGRFLSVCSRNLMSSILAGSPMYSWSQSLHLTLYTPHTVFHSWTCPWGLPTGTLSC